MVHPVVMLFYYLLSLWEDWEKYTINNQWKKCNVDEADVLSDLTRSSNFTITNLFVLASVGAKNGDIMFTIPKGATNVRIEERAKSYNFLSTYN